LWVIESKTGRLLVAEQFDVIVSLLEHELDTNARGAGHLAEAEIVTTARELRLNPEPSGTSGTAWQAKCPGGHHYIMISAVKNDFGCGYCRRKGGPVELRVFATK
jgi:hypothetical protein